MLSKRIKANIILTNNLKMEYVKKTVLYILLSTSINAGAEVFEQQKQLTLEGQGNEAFYNYLSFKESTGNPDTTNNEGAIGKYQILESTLKELKYDWVTLKEFRKDPTIFPESMQKEALNKKIIGDLKLLQYQWFRKDSSINYMNFVGTKINGIPITVAGLIASCHIGGAMGTIKWIDSQGKRNPGDTNRSTIGAYMLEFSKFTFNLEELCLKNYGERSILSIKQSKSSTMVLKSQDTAIVTTLHYLKILNQNTNILQQPLVLKELTLGYKQLYQNTTELYSTLEVQHLKGMGLLMLLGMGKLNGTTQVNGLEQLHMQETLSHLQKRVIDYSNSILNRFGMLLGMLKYATYSLHLAF